MSYISSTSSLAFCSILNFLVEKYGLREEGMNAEETDRGLCELARVALNERACKAAGSIELENLIAVIVIF